MPNFFLLTRLDLRFTEGTNTYSESFYANLGHYIRVYYESLDEEVEMADFSRVKVRRGYRAKIEISFIEKDSVRYQDFLRMCANRDAVSITYSEPLDFSGKNLIITDFSGEPITANITKIRVTAHIKENLYNIPSMGG